MSDSGPFLLIIFHSGVQTALDSGSYYGTSWIFPKSKFRWADSAGSDQTCIGRTRERELIEYRSNPGTNCKDFVVPDLQWTDCFKWMSWIFSTSAPDSQYIFRIPTYQLVLRCPEYFPSAVNRSVSPRRRKSWQVGFPSLARFPTNQCHSISGEKIYNQYAAQYCCVESML